MIVNGESIKSLNTAFSTIFANAFNGVESQKDKIATTVPSSTKSQEYGWLGSFPRIREWVGDKVINQLSASSYSILNKNWEVTVGVSQADLEDDNLGIYKPMIEEMGTEAASHPDDLCFKALQDGDKTKCYDGQYFFDTDHQVGGKSVSNKIAGSDKKWMVLDTSRAIKPIIFQERKKPIFKKMAENAEYAFMKGEEVIGVEARYNVGYGFWQMAFQSQEALTADNFNKIRQKMRRFKNDSGKPLGIKPTVIVVHPDLEATAEKLFATKTVDTGGDNPLYQKVEIVIADKWA